MNDELRPSERPTDESHRAPVGTTSPIAEFSHWLDGELALLHARWAHAAAPMAEQADSWGHLRGANKS